MALYEATQPDHLRRATWKRDEGVCNLCKRECRRWHMDHIIPIWNGGEPFELANLQTLCHKCHKAKTKVEAGQRAEMKRGQSD